MLEVPTQIRANLNAWKQDPKTARRYPATVLPPWGPPRNQLERISQMKARDNNPAFDSDPRVGVIVEPETGDTVTLSTFNGSEYYQEVKADGDVTALLSSSDGIYKVSYYTPRGEESYSAYQSFTPATAQEGWHGSREVKA